MMMKYLVVFLLLAVAMADDLSVTSVSQCKGSGGTYQVTSASCENCNWGEEATLTGVVNPSSCSDVCVVATATIPGMGDWVVFEEDDYDCTVALSTNVKIPVIPSYLTGVAGGKVVIEFFDGGCDGGTRRGCSVVTVSAMSAGAVRVVVASTAVALVGAAALAGALVFRRCRTHQHAVVADGGGGADTKGGFEFSRMKGESMA